jgi:hypothetical protein
MKKVIAAAIAAGLVGAAGATASTVYLLGGHSEPTSQPATSQPASQPAARQPAPQPVETQPVETEPDEQPAQPEKIYIPQQPNQQTRSEFWNQCFIAHEAEIDDSGMDGPTASDVGDYCRTRADELGLR